MLKILFLTHFILLSIIYADTYPSLLWIKSLEYNLSCKQVYQSAQRQFEALDLENVTSVMLEQNQKKGLPLAIVTDIDETILLNYDFQKTLLKDKKNFSYDLFEEHINLGQEIPVYGAVEYFQYLAKRGVKVIYISNRLANTKNQTYEYLKKHGYPIKSTNDLLLKGEKENWNSSKSSRRIYISNKYTVIQMFGDNLKDFVDDKKELLLNKSRFGVSWFLIPNPLYGTWLNNKESNNRQNTTK